MCQAEVALKHDPKPEPNSAQRLDQAWQQVCFHHFHDTLGGTCIPSAYAQVDAQLGMARAIADDLIHLSVRRQMVPLKDDPMQRIILFNASDAPFDSYTEFEPWLDWTGGKSHWQGRDENDQIVPMQLLKAEAPTQRLDPDAVSSNRGAGAVAHPANRPVGPRGQGGDESAGKCGCRLHRQCRRHCGSSRPHPADETRR